MKQNKYGGKSFVSCGAKKDLVLSIAKVFGFSANLVSELDPSSWSLN